MTWTAASGASWYFVEVHDANFTVAWKDSVSFLTSTARNLLPATSYTWRVQAANAAGRGTWISGAFRTPVAVPAAPGNLTASSNTGGASLSWTPVSGAVSYVVEVYTDNNLTTRVWKDSLTNPPATVSNLLSGRTYAWRVQATNAGGASGWTMSSFTFVQPTAVERTGNSIPSEFSLGQNYPNPFNPATNIEFSLPVSSHVRITIYNALGNLVEVLADHRYAPGRYLVSWEASSFPSGVYFYRLQTAGFAATKRLMLVK